MKYVLIQYGEVRQIFDADPMLPTGEDVPGADGLAVMEAPDDVNTDWRLLDGVLQPPSLFPVDMQLVRTDLKAQVDTDAETERLKYITPGNGQAMTYQQKVAEAQAFKAATNPKASDYPILSSEVGITAETLTEVADIVLAAFAQWQQIGAAIESIRLGAKRDIDATENEAAARAVVNAIVWPQPAL